MFRNSSTHRRGLLAVRTMNVEGMDRIREGGLMIVEARLRDRSRIEKAISTQDRLREKSKKVEWCKRGQEMA